MATKLIGNVKGSDANVTTDNIQNALGYVPGDKAELDAVKLQIATKEAVGTAAAKVTEHNASTTAHSDIRTLITQGDAAKVNKADIVDNLTTDASDKPLSASQGAVLNEKVVSVDEAVKAIDIPKNLSELTDDVGYALDSDIPTALPASDVYAWAKEASKPTYTYSEVGADPAGTADSAVTTHNVNTEAHNDIRLLVAEVKTALEAFLDTDEETMNELSELIVAINNNKSSIESLTSGKVNVSDIVNNLTTSVTNKPLSAAQGVALKKLIDSITVPTKLSELTSDASHRTVTDTEKTTWNGKQPAGNYALKSEIPDISGKANTSDLTSHTGNTTVHITAAERTAWNKKLDSVPSEYVTETELAAKNYLTSVPSEYVTETELTAKKYLTSVPSEYVTETELTAKGYAKQSEVDELSGEIADHASDTDIHVTTAEKNTWNAKQPAGDYALTSELEAEVTAREQAVASLNERLGQQTVLVAEGTTQEEAEAWLAENGDTTKVYLMPDETFWQYTQTTEVVEGGGIAYTNQLPTATDTDGTTIYGGDYNGDGVNDGYKTSTRLSGSSGSASSSSEAMCASGFIPASMGDTLRIQGTTPVAGTLSYVISYDSSMSRLVNQTFVQNDDGSDWSVNTTWYTYEDGVLTIPLTEANFGTEVAYIRFSGHMDENTIVTINEEIAESTGTTTTIVEKWVSTGHGLVATDYDEVIATLNSIVTAHTAEIEALKDGVETALSDDEKLSKIREWDAPIYDAHIPVFELSAEKTAMTDATNTPDAIYAMYDALMAKYPRYITKTDLGLCSDGVNHVYRYDFREPEPYHQSNMPWSETKTKAIIVSGIHYEWAGIYSLYYALEEITENPNLYDLRRNTHFIVVPCMNPYCTITSNYNASMGVLNANGVQIHRNFEVGFIYPDESGYVEAGNRNHGGTEPLSEVETQYVDNIMKENTDSAFFLTCHNFDSPSETNGLGFIWASSATKYMCNMGYRLADKMTKAWLDKWGDDLEAGIADYRTDNVTDDFIRFGHAHMSATDGTETRQATKYGIQGNNVEVCNRFYPHGTTDNVEPALSEFTLSRGAETYVNFLLTACGTYDYKDKEQYYK